MSKKSRPYSRQKKKRHAWRLKRVTRRKRFARWVRGLPSMGDVAHMETEGSFHGAKLLEAFPCPVCRHKPDSCICLHWAELLWVREKIAAHKQLLEEASK